MRAAAALALLPAVLLLLALSDVGRRPELDASAETEGGRRLAARGWWKRRSRWRPRQAAWLETQAGLGDDAALDPPLDYARPKDLASTTGAGGAPPALLAKETSSSGGHLLEFCQDGLLNYDGGVCCPSACGQCGGVGCNAREGGPESCCTEPIHSSGKVCGVASDVQCRMPTSCAQDKCLLECPYDPGCAAISSRRGWSVKQTQRSDEAMPLLQPRSSPPPPHPHSQPSPPLADSA